MWQRHLMSPTKAQKDTLGKLFHVNLFYAFFLLEDILNIVQSVF